MTLLELYSKHKRGDWPDKGSVHSYIEVYEDLLTPYRTTARNVLEIGLMSGESLRMWAEYFEGTVFGMDCDLKPHDGLAELTDAINEGYNVKIGDASSPAEIERHFKGIMFDVVIEDAGHHIDQQTSIFHALRPYMAKGSVYIIEDIQDIDATRPIFEIMGFEVIDRRAVKGRYDDVLAVQKF